MFFCYLYLYFQLNKNEFSLWESLLELCWCCITQLSVCHSSKSSAFKRTRWAVIGYDWCKPLHQHMHWYCDTDPSHLTPFLSGPQVTKILKVSSCPLQTAHLTTLNVAHLVSQKQDPSIAFKWKLKDYKLHPWCSQRALGSAQAAWAMLCVSQLMPP